MGKIVGHILPGVIVSDVGLWQLFNHMRLLCLRPDSYVSPVWFPAPRVRYLELIVFIALGVIGIADVVKIAVASALGSIPSSSVARTSQEHAVVLGSLVLYGGCALHLDRVRARGRRTLGMLLMAVVFAQELLMFHFHSADHAGIEGRFHWFMEAIVAACLVTALLGAGLPRSFAVGLARSACFTFQGLWFLAIGVMWIPRLVPKGCSIQQDGGDTFRCHDDASLHRAMAIVNLLFGWCLSLLALLVVALHLYVCHKYPAEASYGQLPEAEDPKAPKCRVVSGSDGVQDQFTTLEIQV